MVFTPATYVTPALNLTFWEWSGTEATYYDYLKHSQLATLDGNANYLFWNGTANEYRSDTTDKKKYYICEASGTFFSV